MSEKVIESCNRSLADWRNNINKYRICGCHTTWENIKRTVLERNEESDRYKRIINSITGNREIHIIKCGHVWYGVKWV
jgi:hypothetical protein